MKIEVSRKTVCGVERYYSVCELSSVILHLMNRKSFGIDDIHYLMRARWNVVVKNSEPSQ